MGQTPGLAVCDEWPGGFSWRPVNEGDMCRTSHALFCGQQVWLIDAIDGDGLDEILESRLAGRTVAGVVILLDRHLRGIVPIAMRWNAPIMHPPGTTGWNDKLVAAAHAAGVQIHVLGGTLPGTDIQVLPLVDNRWWSECALWDAATRTLVVAEVLGSNAWYCSGYSGAIGMHPFVRLKPPRKLMKYSPERVLCSHGNMLVDQAKKEIARVYAQSRSSLLRMPLAIRHFLPGSQRRNC